MIWMITIIPAIVISTIMATIVWLRHRHHRSGQLFIAVVIVQILLAISSSFRPTATTPNSAIIRSVSSWVLLSLLALTLLLFFAALYVPEWWQKRRTLGLITLPYVLAIGLILLSTLPGVPLLITGAQPVDTGHFQTIPGSFNSIMGGIFMLGWLPHLALLSKTFARQREERRSILVFVGVLILSGINGYLIRRYPALLPFITILDQVMLIGALAYLLLQRGMFETSQVVMDQALAGMAEGIALLTSDATVHFTNRAMEQHLGLQVGQELETITAQGFSVDALRALLGRERREALQETTTQAITITASPIIDRKGQLQGHLLLTRDVTQARAYEHTLKQHQADLLQTVEELQKTQLEQHTLAETIRALSLPIIPVANGVIVMPLIGKLDETRTSDFEQRFLQGLQDNQAHTAVLDLTGVPPIDQSAAGILLRSVCGARLLGVRTILVGIRPEIAQSIITLGIRQDEFTTAPTLQDALDALLHKHEQLPTKRYAPLPS
jgi:anti-anti-sigma regulatory factor/PAS domain-containing protein